jgi:hypothetical protein
MPRRPTGRPAHRPRGSKNKTTIERELIAARQLEEREDAMRDGRHEMAAARRSGRKLAREVLDDLMQLGMGLTASYQELAGLTPQRLMAQGEQTVINGAMEDKFWKAAEFTKDCATALANYQSPRLKAAIPMGAPPIPQTPALPGPQPGSTNVQYFLEHTYRRMIKQVNG